MFLLELVVRLCKNLFAELGRGALKFFYLFAMLVVSACVTDGAMSPVTREPVVNHDKYRKITLNWAETGRGLTTRLYLRGLNDGGQYRICAYYVDDATGVQKLSVRAWLDEAYFTYKGEKIVSTKFVPWQARSVGAKAACVTTKALYKDVNLFGIRVEGNTVRVSF